MLPVGEAALAVASQAAVEKGDIARYGRTGTPRLTTPNNGQQNGHQIYYWPRQERTHAGFFQPVRLPDQTTESSVSTLTGTTPCKRSQQRKHSGQVRHCLFIARANTSRLGNAEQLVLALQAECHRHTGKHQA